MKKLSPIVSVILFSLLVCALTANAAIDSPLSVHSDGRYLIKRNTGEPFFWLGDTAWQLMNIPPSEVDIYMADRSNKKFNVVQAMVLYIGGFDDPALRPNYRGDLPFSRMNPISLNERYFQHMDYIVNSAENHGLYIALVPIWGSVMDIHFDVNDPENAYNYGYLLANRYAHKDNVIWIVNGEYHKIAWNQTKGDDKTIERNELDLIRSLAQGIRNGQTGNALMTIHPNGWKSSSEHFHNALWLDFNMIQTTGSIGRGSEYFTYEDWQRNPAKPTLLAEPGYESSEEGRTDVLVRYEAYHSVFQGGFGHTYGAGTFWRFGSDWRDYLNLPGSSQMKYLKDLMVSRPNLGRIPDQEIIVSPEGSWTGFTKIRATRASDGGYAMIYFPVDNVRKQISVGTISGRTANAWWFNPRDGLVYDTQNNHTQKPFNTYNCNGSQVFSFNPPGNRGAGYDWVLVLDDASKDFDPPGEIRGNTPPSIRINYPVEHQVVEEGIDIAVNATASDLDGHISKVEFYDNDSLIGTNTRSPYSQTIINPSVGNHQLKAVAFDNDGESNTDIVNIVVRPSGNIYRPIPGKVEAEDFDNGGEGVAYHDTTAQNTLGFYRLDEGVDIARCTDAGRGYNIGSLFTGEWLQYSVNVATTGTYDLHVRVATKMMENIFM